MSKFGISSAVIAAVLIAAGATAQADRRAEARTLAVVMTNDADANAIKVYDARSHALIQTLSTHGRGGVGSNARGIRQFNGDLVAVVNNGSNTVAVFRRERIGLAFQQMVTTTSAPVSIDFGNGHMYVAGATTVDSFVVRRNSVEWMDGTTSLELAEGGAPPTGSTAQVGVVNERQLLVTLKSDPTPGTVDVVELRGSGAIASAEPTAVAAPASTLTPFGFSVYPDGTAVITLAHSNHNGLFRDGAFVDVVAAGQAAPCWTTRSGKYVFTANAGSRTIGRFVGSGSHVFVDNAIAASVPTGGPTDLDSNDGVLGAIDHSAGQSHLSLFTYNRFGELTADGVAINIGVANANGVAIVPAGRD